MNTFTFHEQNLFLNKDYYSISSDKTMEGTNVDSGYSELDMNKVKAEDMKNTALELQKSNEKLEGNDIYILNKFIYI